jgi:hypothetical protein
LSKIILERMKYSFFFAPEEYNCECSGNVAHLCPLDIFET